MEGIERRAAGMARNGLLFASFAAGALLVFDGGLYLFAVGLLFSTLAQCAAAPYPASARRQPCVTAMLALVLAVITVAAVSVWLHHKALQPLDHLSRLLLLPWCAWLANAVRLPRTGLWRGALLGLLVALGYAGWQIHSGLPRAGGAGNPIEFANLVLVLLAVALFAGTRGGRFPWVPLAAWLAGGLVIVWTGSRGALLVWIVLAVLYLCQRHGWSRWRALLAVAMVALLVCCLPGLNAPLRLDQIEPNLDRFVRGDPDSPIGARLELLALAWRGFVAHPWAGVGIENFNRLVLELPDCRDASPMGMCVLSHAHNDLAEWAATMGLPGLLGIVALYGLPLACFVRIIGRAGSGASTAAARAGATLVVVYVLSGLSQSMFAHATTASAYAVFVGLLLGIALHESGGDAPGASGRAGDPSGKTRSEASR